MPRTKVVVEKVPTTGQPLATDLHSYTPLVAIAFVSVIAAHIMRDAYNLNFLPMFMSLFLIMFGMLKLFDIESFVDIFSRYDVVSSRIRGYAYLYPFIQLSLGFAYLGNYFPQQTSIVLIALSGLSLLSVMLQGRERRTVVCGALGCVVRVRLGRVTLVENLLMLVMGCAHLATHTNYWNNIPS